MDVERHGAGEVRVHIAGVLEALRHGFDVFHQRVAHLDAADLDFLAVVLGDFGRALRVAEHRVGEARLALLVFRDALGLALLRGERRIGALALGLHLVAPAGGEGENGEQGQRGQSDQFHGVSQLCW